MSYLALARKWRPRTFSQLVGQEHINKALIKSLNQQRLHHAYLFTGTRGVGKTSVARLMAKALNCEQGISANPCLNCETCIAIEQNRIFDLIEIDGASKTRVEDTRELLDNIQYAPISGRFKIYLIDEVHMLSTHSFNALLKTLEEPPSHVKFLLATTDPQKLPVTVLSRCLQFNLKHLTIDIIVQQLVLILTEECLTFDYDALQILAKAARGSMRDALSLLDQAIASAEDRLRVQDVKAMLGYSQQDYALKLLQALAIFDAALIINICRQIANEGGHFAYVLNELLDYLHQITICQNIPNNNPLLNLAPESQQLAIQFKAEDVQLFYQIGIKGIDEMHLAPTLAIGFEMIVLRMLTFRPATSVPTPTLAYEFVKQSAVTPIIVEKQPEKPVIIEHAPAAPSKSAIIPFPMPVVASPCAVGDWGMILNQIKLTGLAQSAAEHTELVDKNGCELTLRVSKGHQSLFSPSIIQRIENELTTYYHDTIKIKFDFSEIVQSSPAQKKQQRQNQYQQEAESNLEHDLFFQELKEEFSAELIKNSIVSLKDLL